MSQRFYHEEHTWVSVAGAEVTVGLTDYAQEQMGDIIYVELPEEGTPVSEGESFATVESAKAVQDVIAPLSGAVLRVNAELLDTPEIINGDPYGAGWLIVVTPEEGFAVGQLMTEPAYQELLDSDLERDEELV